MIPPVIPITPSPLPTLTLIYSENSALWTAPTAPPNWVLWRSHPQMFLLTVLCGLKWWYAITIAGNVTSTTTTVNDKYGGYNYYRRLRQLPRPLPPPRLTPPVVSTTPVATTRRNTDGCKRQRFNNLFAGAAAATYNRYSPIRVISKGQLSVQSMHTSEYR
jgi:hypothetical protein